jgi:hypothetical protein
VVTVRPWREHAELIDLPAQITACGEAAGLVPVQRGVALLGRVDQHGELVARASFFQRDFILKQRRLGLPMHLIAHEDVIVFRLLSSAAATAAASPGGRVARVPLTDVAASGSSGQDERAA